MSTTVNLHLGPSAATFEFVSEGKVNTLSKSTLQEIDRHISEISGQNHIRVWVFKGAGKTFIAGANIKELAAIQSPDEAREFSQTAHRIFNKIAEADAITIAAVNGAAMGGGCEIALACDLRVMAEGAKIGLPETTIGVLPGWGGTQRLAALVGLGKAREIIYTGGILSATEAAQLGLVNQTVPVEQLEETVNKLVDRLLATGPRALRAAKKAINEGLKTGAPAGLDTEAHWFGDCWTNDEAKEGLTAFLEKRKPNWE